MGKGDPRSTPPADAAPRPLHPDVASALAAVDQVFGHWASPDETGCQHCYRDEEIAYLRRPGVTIPDRVLFRFASEPAENFDDYPAVARRLLPQLLRGVATGTLPWFDETCLPLAQPALDWHSWPAEEVHAIRGFFKAWWRTALDDVDGSPATILVLVVAIGEEAAAYLERWTPGGIADLHLADLAMSEVLDLLCGSMFSLLDEDDRTRKATSDVCSWLSQFGASRMEALGDPALASECRALAEITR